MNANQTNTCNSMVSGVTLIKHCTNGFCENSCLVTTHFSIILKSLSSILKGHGADFSRRHCLKWYEWHSNKSYSTNCILFCRSRKTLLIDKFSRDWCKNCFLETRFVASYFENTVFRLFFMCVSIVIAKESDDVTMWITMVILTSHL